MGTIVTARQRFDERLLRFLKGQNQGFNASFDLKTRLLTFWLVGLFGWGVAPGLSGESPDYGQMVAEIEGLLDASLRASQAGAWPEAQEKATAAYFHVFEHMEGPIRLNLGQGTNFRLELKFAQLRRLIDEHAEHAELVALVEPLREELRALPPQLKGGYTIVAEAEPVDPVLEAMDPELRALLGEADMGFDPEPKPVAAPTVQQTETEPSLPVDPYWQTSLQAIQTNLFRALADYEAGAGDEARGAVRDAQFEGYKNTMMETAVRRHHSQTDDAQVNYAFAQLSQALAREADLATLGEQVDALLRRLEQLAPGLPVPPQVTAKQTAAEPVVQFEAAAIAKAVTIALDGGANADALKDIYFNQYHAGGLRAQLRDEDPARNQAIEVAFSALVEGVEAGHPRAQLAPAREALQAVLQPPSTAGAAPRLPWWLAIGFLPVVVLGWWWHRRHRSVP